MSDTEEARLSHYGVGDELVVSERDTPMEVVGVKPLPIGSKAELIVTNHHGTYRLRENLDGTVSLRHNPGPLIAGDVEVTDAE